MTWKFWTWFKRPAKVAATVTVLNVVETNSFHVDRYSHRAELIKNAEIIVKESQ